MLTAAVAARSCSPRTGESRRSNVCTTALATLHATQERDEEPERRVRDEVRALQHGIATIAAGPAVKTSSDAPTTPRSSSGRDGHTFTKVISGNRAAT